MQLLNQFYQGIEWNEFKVLMQSLARAIGIEVIVGDHGSFRKRRGCKAFNVHAVSSTNTVDAPARAAAISMALVTHAVMY